MSETGNELPEPVTEAIKAAREAVHQTMDESAKEVHVDQTTWWRWESGKRKMPRATWELYLIKTGQREVP